MHGANHETKPALTPRAHCATPMHIMIDLRPIAYLIGRMLIVLAILMLAPAIVDGRAGLHNGTDFLQAALITGAFGALLSITTHNALGLSLEMRQAYLLTAAIWLVIPLFGALPFILGAPGLAFTDAYFEAVSGITTTGSTVIVGLDALPAGMNLWRGMLNWIGGLGIAFVAMIFLPVMRVGGMQFFRTEGFDTFGKIMPRATDIAGQLVLVYAGLTLVCMATYAGVGMTGLDAVVHSMATMATGGFSSSDISFSKYLGAGEYAGALFMLLASERIAPAVVARRAGAWLSAHSGDRHLRRDPVALADIGYRVRAGVSPDPVQPRVDPVQHRVLFRRFQHMGRLYVACRCADWSFWGLFGVQCGGAERVPRADCICGIAPACTPDRDAGPC
jgi:hypothetical protein